MEKCIICGENNLNYYDAEFAPFIKERMFNNTSCDTKLVHCEHCNSSFASKRPNDAQINTFYNDYRGELYQLQREKYEPNYTREFNNNLEYGEEYIQIHHRIMQLLTKKYADTNTLVNILDFGGQGGKYIPNIYNNANKCAYNIKGINTAEGVNSIEFSELSNCQWDLITCCDVLQHVSNPNDIINQINSIMPENGFLYIEVPYEEYPFKNIENLEKTNIHENINFFTTQSFENMFNDANFIIIENNYIDAPLTDKLYEKYIQCLVKKIKPSNYSIMIKQNHDLINNVNNTKKDLKNFSTGINNINNQINGISTEIKNRFCNIESKFENVNNSFYGINNKLYNLNTQINLLHNDITELDEKIGTLFQAIEIMNKKLDKPTFMQQIFSVRHEDGVKVVRIFGIKFYVKDKKD